MEVRKNIDGFEKLQSFSKLPQKIKRIKMNAVKYYEKNFLSCSLVFSKSFLLLLYVYKWQRSSEVYLFSTNGSPPNRFTNASSSKPLFQKQEKKQDTKVPYIFTKLQSHVCMYVFRELYSETQGDISPKGGCSLP